MNNILEDNPQTVAQLAISHSRALAVFTKYNIDYCCVDTEVLKTHVKK